MIHRPVSTVTLNLPEDLLCYSKLIANNWVFRSRDTWTATIHEETAGLRCFIGLGRSRPSNNQKCADMLYLDHLPWPPNSFGPVGNFDL